MIFKIKSLKIYTTRCYFALEYLMNLGEYFWIYLQSLKSTRHLNYKGSLPELLLLWDWSKRRFPPSLPCLDIGSGQRLLPVLEVADWWNVFAVASVSSFSCRHQKYCRPFCLLLDLLQRKILGHFFLFFPKGMLIIFELLFINIQICVLILIWKL